MNKAFMILLFLFSTGFFVYQHSTGVSWDFSVYLMNSHYLFTGDGFFEIGRPPLASFLLGIGEYAYIILVSLLGLFACIKFSEKYKLRPEVFYAFLLSPFVLTNGFSVGTEFLSLSLTILFFAYIERPVSGLFAGLGALAHYNNLPNILFLLFNRKTLLKSLLVCALVFTPWLVFNYVLTGNPVYSFLDQYIKNVAARSYYFMMPDVTHFIYLASFSIPFIIYGMKKSLNKRINLLMFSFLLFRLVLYVIVPFKTPRYLFLVVIPFAFFSTKALKSFNYKIALLPLFLTLLFLPFYYYELENPNKYFESIKLINNSCMTSSNSWVLLNYYGVPSAPAPRQDLVSHYLNEGYALVFYKNVYDPAYVFNNSFMNQLPVLNETHDFIILKNNSACKEVFDYNLSYIDERVLTAKLLFNETITVNDLI